MAVYGNNFSKKVADIRDSALESFDEKFKDEICGVSDSTSLLNHVLSIKYATMKKEFKKYDGGELLDLARSLDFAISNGLIEEIDSASIETSLIAALDSIEDAEMVTENYDEFEQDGM